MTPDIGLYVLGVALLPFVGWCIHVNYTMTRMKKDTSLLVQMHRSPDEFGFGTGQTNRAIMDTNEDLKQCIRDNTRAIRALVHYIEWMAKNTTGMTPPPPINDGGD